LLRLFLPLSDMTYKNCNN